MKPGRSERVGGNHKKQLLEQSPVLQNKQLTEHSFEDSNGSSSVPDSKGSVVQSGIGGFTVEQETSTKKKAKAGWGSVFSRSKDKKKKEKEAKQAEDKKAKKEKREGRPKQSDRGKGEKKSSKLDSPKAN